MKKLFFVFVSLILTVTWSFAADFSPTIMTLTVPETIEYQFDGTDLTIPFTVSGTPAAVWLVINTKGMAENIVDIQNGYLGWHYVNKIDTTVFVSSRYGRDPGETTIIWDGNDQDGNIAAAGTYDYYLWAYDDVTERQRASDFIMIGFDWSAQYTHVIEDGEDGLPLTKPLLLSSIPHFMNHRQNRDDAMDFMLHGEVLKWELGADPHDRALLQTTRMLIYPTAAEYAVEVEGGVLPGSEWSYGGPAFDPNDYSIYYQTSSNAVQKVSTILKWTFVPDGVAVLDEDWLGWDEVTWEETGMAIAMWSQHQTCFSDRNYIYINSAGLHQKELEWNYLRCVSFDGEVIFDKLLHEWYYPDDPNPHDYINGSFHYLATRGNNRWVLVSHTCCLHEMIDTTRLLDDPEDDTDRILWQNQNGDYFMDSAYDPDVEPAWYCNADDKTTSMRRAAVAMDSNSFNVISTDYLGIVSFGVSTQDGSSIGYMSYGDDTVADDSRRNGGGQLVDSGSQFDGLYMNSVRTPDTEHFFANGQTNFVAFDSAHGIITSEPTAVEEEGQAAFSVAQNSPNPFNPTTSISFTIPDADHVTVEVFNVAGQKVDTLVNDFMDAGKHSIVWNASGLSNGVYFYTVKSGDFSKTMKMTLLK
ncbi:MAG TPA: T9SS type A sorting domain-containing protein [bacterium]|nr:T9SS type A sorting domain-containing protein [bacterium]